jgi:hypothetical protein
MLAITFLTAYVCSEYQCAMHVNVTGTRQHNGIEYSELHPERDRIHDTGKILEVLAGSCTTVGNKPLRILEIGGNDYSRLAAAKDWHYETIDVEYTQAGTGGHTSMGGHSVQAKTTHTYNGRHLSFSPNSFDIVLISFVLHHAAENTLFLLHQVGNKHPCLLMLRTDPFLRQVRSIASSFVVIGEDIADQHYPVAWHQRNYDHQPGGIFRCVKSLIHINKIINSSSDE